MNTVLNYERKASCEDKIILSCMRYFVSWEPDVRLLVVDESDAFFDQEKRTLFLENLSSCQLVWLFFSSVTAPRPILKNHLVVQFDCFRDSKNIYMMSGFPWPESRFVIDSMLHAQ